MASFVTPQDNDRLTQIETRLSLLFKTGQPGHAEFLRYYGAAYRYFLAMSRDADAAQDLTNQFAQRFFSGDFQRFDPSKGRFRDFLKVALRHMAIDYFRNQQRGQARPLPEEDLLQEREQSKGFESAWQDELLHHAWKALEQFEQAEGKPFYTALRLKTENPKTRSAQLAEELSRRLNKPMTAEAARQLVHRSRDKFQDILLEEVERSLGTPSRERLEEELQELSLWSYCKDALQRRG